MATCSVFDLLLKAKVEFDFHDSKLGLMVWLAKLESLFGYTFLVVNVLNSSHGIKGVINSRLYTFSRK